MNELAFPEQGFWDDFQQIKSLYSMIFLLKKLFDDQTPK